MTEHRVYIPADKKDRQKFAEEWKKDREFKETEKNRRFAEIRERRKNNPSSGKGSGDGINIEING